MRSLTSLTSSARDISSSRESREAVRHVISLGCRCSQASVYRTFGQRRYACPFDWIFSSAVMVTHCLQDDFRNFLDRRQYFENATVFDAVGLPPGSPPRERKLIGHKIYSTMTAGVGRGTIFNHRNPLHNEEDRYFLKYVSLALGRTDSHERRPRSNRP